MVRGHTWSGGMLDWGGMHGGMHGWEHVWLREACVAGGHAHPPPHVWLASARYASYWNAILLNYPFGLKEQMPRFQ